MSAFDALMGIILFCNVKPCDFASTFVTEDGTYVLTICNDLWQSSGSDGQEYIINHWHTKDRKYGHTLIITQTNCGAA